MISFGLLGPLEVLIDGRSRVPTALKRRALLALLLCRNNETLSPGTLVDGLWGESPPKSAVAALHGHLSALRRVLGPDGPGGTVNPRHHPLLVTESGGYRVRVPPEQLDLTRFRARVRSAKNLRETGHCSQAREALIDAIELWRGPPLADLHGFAALEGIAQRLDEERVAAVQERINIDLCRGNSADVVGELVELCCRYPLRESLYKQLMLALAATGRRAEALSTYSRARRIMVAEAGIEPGPDLRRVQQSVLDGDTPPVDGHRGHAGAHSAG